MSPRGGTVAEVAFGLPLLVLAGVPLLASTVCELPAWALGLDAAAFLLLAACWCRFTRGAPVETPPARAALGRLALAERLRPLAVHALLLALTLVAYAGPMLKHFWGGCDDHAGFSEGCADFWSRKWDVSVGRPTLGWVAGLSRALTPDALDGFLWMAAALCWLNACLLYAIVRRLVPQAAGVAAVAAVLLVVSRADSSRFYVLWTADFYWMALFLLLLSLWLLVLSRQLRSRALLLVACAVLTAALLTSEGVFPLALLGLVAIAITRREGGAVVWTAAWLGTIGLLAARFLVSLSVRGGAGAYQVRQVSGVLQDPLQLWTHLVDRTEALRLYFARPNGWMRTAHLGVWLAAFSLAAACVWLAAPSRRTAPAPRRWPRGLALGVGVGAAAFLLGAAPFLHHAGLFRTMFFAAPGLALALACATSLLVAWVSPRSRTFLLAAGIGLLAAETTVVSTQSQSDLQLTSRIRFDRTLRVYEQVRALTSRTDGPVLVLFVLEEVGASPLSDVNYAIWFHARDFLDSRAYQTEADSLGYAPVFTDEGVRLPHNVPPHAAFFPYERVVAFHAAPDGTLSFLPRLPPRLLPAGVRAEGYDPLAWLRAGPLAPLHHLRSRYVDADFTDVVDASRGVVFTGSWLPLSTHEQHVSRWARNGAGFVVNPALAGPDALEFDLEPGGPLADRDCELRVTDAKGEVTLRMPIRGRRRVRLPLAAPSEGLAMLTLWLEAGPGADVPADGIVYRITRRDAGVGRLQAAADAADVFADRLTPARSWRPLYLKAGREGHRWFEDGAELITGAPLTAALELTVEPGRSPPGHPCRLTLEDEAGNALADADLTSGRTLLFSLPRPVGPGTVLRLRTSAECDARPGERPAWSVRCFRARCIPPAD